MYLPVLAGVIFAAAGQVALKVGADGRKTLAEFCNAWIVLGLVCYAIGTLLWIFSLSRTGLTVVYPFTALTFVLVYLAGVVAFGEHAGFVQWLGIALILTGLYCVAGLPAR
ncbi:EamA family transporter [Ralstonia mannitolilytica]|uniref:EamA family transporter n=1 Tax=Ralstonia mannitolilytica TaxID=105219 RepID=UPI001E2AA46D|nr:EamA family transporter [Ralstonia mannitolilytica]